MNFTEKTYRHVRQIGYLCILIGICIIVDSLYYEVRSLLLGNTLNTYYSLQGLLLRGLPVIFLFLLGNRCLRIREGADDTYSWEGVLTMLRNYLFVAIFVALAWRLLDYLNL